MLIKTIQKKTILFMTSFASLFHERSEDYIKELKFKGNKEQIFERFSFLTKIIKKILKNIYKI